MSKTTRPNAVNSTATTASVQDYLAAIYDLASSGKPVIGARLAKHMAISAPAVTESIQRLSRGGYVKGGPGKALPPPPKGREIPAVMGRRHPPRARRLTDAPGLTSSDAHRDAHPPQRAPPPRVGERMGP